MDTEFTASSGSSAVTRRDLLKKGAAAAGAMLLWGGMPRLAPAGVQHADDGPEMYDFVLTRTRFSDLRRPNTLWNLDPSGDHHFLDNLKQMVRLRVPVRPRDGQRFTREADLADRRQVLEFPFLFMTDEREVHLRPDEKANLREFLEKGGFLFMDDCVVGNTGDFFYRSMMREFDDMFPGKKLEVVPDDHPLYTCYFRLPGMPFFHGVDHPVRGLHLDGRLAAILTPGDIHCAWCQSQDQWFGPGSFQAAVKAGVNVVVFALTQQGRLAL